jgi:CheY-like chemotaxis protein
MLILVIEDDVFFQKFYSLKLQEQGFQVDIAGNGEEGLEKIKTEKPDLIILDIIMPIMDGFEVLETLSNDQELKKIPVLVFSTLGQEKDVQKAIKLGARDYINKSYFDLKTLLTKISSVINH